MTFWTLRTRFRLSSAARFSSKVGMLSNPFQGLKNCLDPRAGLVDRAGGHEE